MFIYIFGVNNTKYRSISMGKSIDRICIAVALFIISFIATVELSHNSALALVISITISIVATICMTKIGSTTKSTKLPFKHFDTYMIVKGVEYQLELLRTLYQQYSMYERCIYNDDTIIMPIFKFGTLSRDDILKAYTLAQKLGKNTIYIISNNIDRSILTFAGILYDRTFHFVRSRELYKMAERANTLPTIPHRETKSRMSYHTILSIVWNRKNAPRLLFTSLLLLFVGFITPIRGYYFTMSAVSAIIALLCIFSSNNTSSATHLPPR